MNFKLNDLIFFSKKHLQIFSFLVSIFGSISNRTAEQWWRSKFYTLDMDLIQQFREINQDQGLAFKRKPSVHMLSNLYAFSTFYER